MLKLCLLCSVSVNPHSKIYAHTARLLSHAFFLFSTKLALLMCDLLRKLVPSTFH